MKGMRQILLLAVLLSAASAKAQTLVSVRCYFDGNIQDAQYFTVANEEELDTPFDISVAALTRGVHRLYVDVMNDDGIWSLYDEDNVQIMGDVNMAQLNALEYFFDEDPGWGEGIQVAIGGEEIDQEFELSVQGLPNGIHNLYVRVRDGAGQWSHYSSQVIHVQGSVYDEIVAAEYFFNADPGFGNGNPISVMGIAIDEDITLSVAGLPRGVHRLYIRTMDAKGQWSLYHEENIQVEGGDDDENMVTAEYFFDEDPGFGNGYVLPVEVGVFIDQDFDIIVPELSWGEHIMYVRVKDGADQWSLYAHDTLIVCDMVIPDISLVGELCEGNSVQLDAGAGYLSYLWSNDASSQSITVSENGIYNVTVSDEDCTGTFSEEVVFAELPVPTIVQDGNTVSTDVTGFAYQWYFEGDIIDGATGSSYDGTEDGTYTVVISNGECQMESVAFEFTYTGVNEVEGGWSIYPNPADDRITVSVGTTGADFSLEDALGNRLITGRMAGSYEIPVKHFSSGIYFLRINGLAQKIVIQH